MPTPRNDLSMKPFQILTRHMLDEYLSRDTVSALLDSHSGAQDEALTCQKWLRDTPPKRLVFEQLYGDLLSDGPRMRILDIGGGITALSSVLAKRHDYHLVDLMAHDDMHAAKAIEDRAGRAFIHQSDWYEFLPKGNFDVVIANDIFPNVDQRLALFVERFTSCSTQVRMSLTYYNTPRFYLTRRVDAEEYLCLLAWGGRETFTAIEPYLSPKYSSEAANMQTDVTSVYPNGRHVALVALQSQP